MTAESVELVLMVPKKLLDRWSRLCELFGLDFNKTLVEILEEELLWFVVYNNLEPILDRADVLEFLIKKIWGPDPLPDDPELTSAKAHKTAANEAFHR